MPTPKPLPVVPSSNLKSDKIAITGTAGFLGSTLLKMLLGQREVPQILALDKNPPPFSHKKIKWASIDLTETGIDQKIANVLNQYKIKILIHAALLNQPLRNVEKAHEIQSVGTMHLLTGTAGAEVQKLILASTTDIYGAFPDNPNFLTEEHKIRGGRLSPFLKDKVEAEQEFLKYQKEHPECVVTILRPATILGPTVNNFKTHFLQNKIIPTVLGFDPLIQFVHETDVLRAFLKVIQEDHPGIFNIVAKGVMPLSRAIRMLGKIAVPTPSFLLYSSAEVLWNLNIGSAPGTHINFLKYLCIADGTKAWQKLNFLPIYTSQEALMSFSGKDLKKETIAIRLEEMEEELRPH